MRNNREISFSVPLISAAKSITLVALIVLSQRVLGQFADNFSDGDFSANPGWSGNASVFTVNASMQLQLNNSVAGTSYLSVPFTLNTLDELNWEFFIRETFAPSSSNYGRVYLVSDQSNLTGPLNGYYLQFGEAGTLDAVELFRQAGTTSTSVCRAASGRIANSVGARVKVSRDATGMWKLLIDYSGGSNFVEEASASDVTYTTSGYIGVVCIYTSSNANKFFFDDFSINQFVVPDATPPTIEVVSVQSANHLSIFFSEAVEQGSAEMILNYHVSNGMGNPAAATLQPDTRTVVLAFPQDFPNGIARSIDVSGVRDVAGNTMVSAQKEFMYFNAVPAMPNDIIITEIFADPSPSVGLPEVEFLEIYNRSTNPFNVNGWKITDGSSTGTLGSFILLPSQYLILAPQSAASLFNPYGNVLGLAIFPTLNNSGDAMTLLDPGGAVINAVHYYSTWYGDVDKQGGGYSLERIDPEDFCLESENWIASNNPTGGTPGTQNSVFEITPDLEGPKMISCEALNSTTIELTFNERLSSQPPQPTDFSIQPALAFSSITFSDGMMKKLKVEFTETIQPTTVYDITASNIFDCPGNSIQDGFNSQILKLDNIAPSVVGITATNSNEILIEFSEPMASNTLLDPGSYSLSIDNSHPLNVSPVSGNVYALAFEVPLINGVERTLTISGLTDLSGNGLSNPVQPFLYFVPQPLYRNDVIITELFPDPTPTLGLPESEFVEIFNRSQNAIQLQNWILTDGTTVGRLPERILLPNEYLIITAASYTNSFTGYGSVVGIFPFPSLNNSADAMVLKDAADVLIDSVRYSSSWYHSEDKEDGGWTLERKDLSDFCSEEENWSASVNVQGGTPGNQNSIFEISPDLTGPKLLGCAVVGDTIIEFEFDEKLHAVLPGASSFPISPPLAIQQIMFSDNTLKKVQLFSSESISATTVYTVNVQDLMDCPGNLIQPGFATCILKLDNIHPTVTRVETLSQNELIIEFSEQVDLSAVLEPLNYSTSSGEHPREVATGIDGAYILRFDISFTNGVSNILIFHNVRDLAGNELLDNQYDFRYFVEYPSQHKDVIITEIMADQSPAVGLPEAEFVEIYNRGENPVDLAGWTIADDGDPTPLDSQILLPGQFLILCASSHAYRFVSFGQVLGVANFPSLNNTGDSFVLKNHDGVMIDSVHYDLSWYNDDEEEKQDGGWTLELIYPENTCAEKENWMASMDFAGGTPGRQNSVYTEKPDLTAPTLISAVAQNASELLVTFSEKLEASVPIFDRFSLNPVLSIAGIEFANQTLTAFRIRLSEDLTGGVLYTLTVNEIFDCPGNAIDADANSVTFALPQVAESMDILVNEILFNPTSTGVDFIEVYNASDKYINLKDWKLASRDDEEIVNHKVISSVDLLIAPHAFLVFTEDSNVLKGEYAKGQEENFFETDIPSLPDDKGSVVLIDPEGNTIDYVTYRDNYHSIFIQEDEGVSLERLNVTTVSLDPDNWKSASTSVQATPGYLNSNAIGESSPGDNSIQVSPEVFLPSVGQPSFTTISYKFEKPGYVGSVRIIDSRGNEIKTIASNELLSAEGFFRWDGDRDDGSKARVGSYMIYVEVFDDKGAMNTFRKRVVVATKF